MPGGAHTLSAHVVSSDSQEGARWRHALQQELLHLIRSLYAAPCMHDDTQGFSVLRTKPSPLEHSLKHSPLAAHSCPAMCLAWAAGSMNVSSCHTSKRMTSHIHLHAEHAALCQKGLLTCC